MNLDGIYGGAFPAPGSDGALEFHFFLEFKEGYGKLYMYGPQNSWSGCITSPPSFGCMLFADTFEMSTLMPLPPDFTSFGTTSTTAAPFCATKTAMLAGMMGSSPPDYSSLWAMGEMIGGFFVGVEGDFPIDGYGEYSGMWTKGGNIGEYVKVSDMAICPE